MGQQCHRVDISLIIAVDFHGVLIVVELIYLPHTCIDEQRIIRQYNLFHFDMNHFSLNKQLKIVLTQAEYLCLAMPLSITLQLE